MQGLCPGACLFYRTWQPASGLKALHLTIQSVAGKYGQAEKNFNQFLNFYLLPFYFSNYLCRTFLKHVLFYLKPYYEAI